MPLPLKSQFGLVELVTGLRNLRIVPRADIRLAECQHRLAYALLVLVDPHEGPAVLPRYRLEVRDASVRLKFLEMNEPPIAVFQIDQGALVRAVGRGRTFGQDDLVFIRPVDV